MIGFVGSCVSVRLNRITRYVITFHADDQVRLGNHKLRSWTLSIGLSEKIEVLTVVDKI